MNRSGSLYVLLSVTTAGMFLVLLPHAVGSFLPGEHSTTVNRDFPQEPDELWPLLADPEAAARRSGRIGRIEILGKNAAGLPVWREFYGDNSFATFEQTQSLRPRLLVQRIAETSAPMAGSWSFELKSKGGRTELAITERAVIRNPLFRFLFHFFMDKEESLRLYLDDLARFLEKQDDD